MEDGGFVPPGRGEECACSMVGDGDTVSQGEARNMHVQPVDDGGAMGSGADEEYEHARFDGGGWRHK